MPKLVKFRELQHLDQGHRKQILDLLKSEREHAVSERSVKAFFSSPNRFIHAAFRGGRIVGFALTSINKERGRLSYVLVEPSERYRNIGNRLFLSTLNGLRNRGAKTASIRRVENNRIIRSLRLSGFPERTESVNPAQKRFDIPIGNAAEWAHVEQRVRKFP
ncbi:GNAT family N-acetyltransferase [Candidatus Micrarchaeota archaeon]|nr:GNAT family N-acetyltransferase [Candidatus Micrarchaeota archaeon]